METFQELFPGVSILLTNGRVVTVSPWSAYKVAHEVPVKIGSLMSVVLPAVRESADEGDARVRILAAVISSAGTLADFLCSEAGLTGEDLKGLLAEDLVKIAQAVVEQNAGFFAALVRLRMAMGKEIVTPTG